MRGDPGAPCRRAANAPIHGKVVKRILSAANAPEAHVAVAVLENAGIEAVVQGEHMGGLPAGLASRPSVWVRDEDYDTACELLGVKPEPTTQSNTGKSQLRLLVVAIIALVLLLLLQS